MTRVNARTSVFWVATLLLGLLVGSTLVGGASAAPAGPPGGLEVAEQNLDQDGNIKVHEQGVAQVDVQNESFDVNFDFPLNQDVTVTNTPLPVEGTVNVGNYPVSQTVDGTVGAQQEGPWNVTVTDMPPMNLTLAPADRAFAWSSSMSNNDVELVEIDPPMNVSTMIIGAPDEITISFNDSEVFMGSSKDDFGRMALSLFQPYLVESFRVRCWEAICTPKVSLIGY